MHHGLPVLDLFSYSLLLCIFLVLFQSRSALISAGILEIRGEIKETQCYVNISLKMSRVGRRIPGFSPHERNTEWGDPASSAASRREHENSPSLPPSIYPSCGYSPPLFIYPCAELPRLFYKGASLSACLLRFVDLPCPCVSLGSVCDVMVYRLKPHYFLMAMRYLKINPGARSLHFSGK